MEAVALTRMAQGAIEERMEYEMGRIIQNVLDPNTDPTAKRQLQITVDLKPNEARTAMDMKATVKAKLATTVPISTSLYITSDRNGEVIVEEAVSQVPGQIGLDGREQEAPKLLSISAQI